MLVSISLEDSLTVAIEEDGAYSPDILDDMTSRCRDLFRLAMADCAHLHQEHEQP